MTLTPDEITVERICCRRSPIYFIDTYCHALRPGQDGEPGAWERITLWPHQREGITAIHTHDRVIILKARQLGITWMVLFYIVWLMVWRSIATTLVFSRNDDEAMDLLDVRIKGIWERLPAWMKDRVVPNKTTDNKHHWKLSGGSSCTAFSTRGGDGRTATLALIDEADLCPNLTTMLGSIEPTASDGGKIVLISRAEKGTPDSVFKRVWRDARGGGTYYPIFLPWWVRPGRTKAWYANRVRESLAKDGSLDTVHKQYPATEEEALEADSVDKRIPGTWLERIWKQSVEWTELDELPGLRIYEEPIPGRTYTIGIDPAEGLVGGDDSTLVVIDEVTGWQVAASGGKLTPRELGEHADKVSIYYNRARVLPERNNHGHACIVVLEDLGCPLVYFDDEIAGSLKHGDGRVGYPTHARSKARLWTQAAEDVKAGRLVIVDYPTYIQVQSIDRKTLSGPPGNAVDDYAISLVLANVARQSGSFWADLAEAARGIK